MARIDDVRDLAVKAMGWEATDVLAGEYFEIKHPSRGVLYWRKGYQDTWNPYADANTALEVVEAMQRKGFWLRYVESSRPGYFSASFIIPGNMRPPAPPQFFYSGAQPTFCEAICAAALAAIREAK